MKMSAPGHSKRSLAWLAHEIFTVPNAMTAYRLMSAPKAYRETRDLKASPKRNLTKVALRSLTDLEGNVARLERVPKIGSLLAALGFRTSELGREGDPVADAVYGAAVAAGGMKGEVLPKGLMRVALAQKLFKSCVTVSATLQGKKLEVRNLGKTGELMLAVGAPIYMAAETTANPTAQEVYRAAGLTLMIGGLVCASAASVELSMQAGYVEAPGLQQTFDRVNGFLDKLVPGS